MDDSEIFEDKTTTIAIYQKSMVQTKNSWFHALTRFENPYYASSFWMFYQKITDFRLKNKHFTDEETIIELYEIWKQFMPITSWSIYVFRPFYLKLVKLEKTVERMKADVATKNHKFLSTVLPLWKDAITPLPS